MLCCVAAAGLPLASAPERSQGPASSRLRVLADALLGTSLCQDCIAAKPVKGRPEGTVH